MLLYAQNLSIRRFRLRVEMKFWVYTVLMLGIIEIIKMSGPLPLRDLKESHEHWHEFYVACFLIVVN